MTVLGKPILEYQIESLTKAGITDITLVIGYLGHVIQDYFKNGAGHGVRIDYITEEKPLGTAGALFYLKDKIRDDFLLVFGDLMLDIDWGRFMKFHKERQGSITLFGHPGTHPADSDLILAGVDGRVIGIDPKNHVRNYYYRNFVNAGVYCVNPSILELFTEAEKKDLEKDVITGEIGKGSVYSYRSTEYVKDMGTPERYASVTRNVEAGLVRSRSFRNKQKCIFLDRDGTINRLVGFLNKVEQMELLPGAAEAIKKVNASEYLAIIVTNQPVIARGECSCEELERIHAKLETELGENGAYVDDIFFCPHHPHKGYAGEVPELKTDCECRKPKIGMLIEAAEKYNIDLKNSWYVGDSSTDIQTGINGGTHTMLVRTGEGGQDGKYLAVPEYIEPDLYSAVEKILELSI